MQADPDRYPSKKFFLSLCLYGGLVGMVLFLLRAPFWLYYAAPLLMTPLVFWELRRLDAGGDPLDAFPLRFLSWHERLRYDWTSAVLIGVGILFALASTVCFTQGAALFGFVAAAGFGILLVVFVSQMGRGATLEIHGALGQQLIVAAAERERELPDDASVLLVKMNQSWIVVPRDRPSEKLSQFDSEDEAEAAAERLAAERGGRCYRVAMEWSRVDPLIMELLEEIASQDDSTDSA
jgi:hypothetical protein